MKSADIGRDRLRLRCGHYESANAYSGAKDDCGIKHHAVGNIRSGLRQSAVHEA